MPVNPYQFHIGFIGQIFQGCAGGQQVINGRRLLVDFATSKIKRQFAAQLTAGCLKRGFLSFQYSIDAKQCWANIAVKRPNDLIKRGIKHGSTGVTKCSLAHVAHIDIGQGQAAVLDHLIKAGDLYFYLCFGQRCAVQISKCQTVDQAPLGFVEFRVAGLIKLCDCRSRDLNRIQQLGGCQRDIGDLFYFWRCIKRNIITIKRL